MANVRPIAELSKRDARNIKKHRQIFVASGILVINKKVLLIQRGPKNEPSPNEWGLPCGHVEHGETPDKAAVREFFEETGIRVKNSKLVGTETYFFDKGNARIYITECIYVVQPRSREIRVTLDKEHAAHAFVSKSDLRKYVSLLEPRKCVIKNLLK